MTRKKRRMFDIEVPESEAAAAPAANDPGQGSRRGPMASAIAENAGALAVRRETEAAIRAENDALAHEYVALQRAGLAVCPVPLVSVVTEALVRDRKPGPDPELDDLVTSIREVGLSNPIRVEEREDGRWELIQGWRRLQAYRRLLDETGDETWAEIPAGILPRGEGVAMLYRRMVDENVVRKDLSFAEMAEVAQHYAADPATEPTDVDAAVAELFQSAGYQKRSYIRSFARLLQLVGRDLIYAHELPRSLGLALLKRLEEDPGEIHSLRAALAGWEERSVADELDVLRRFVGGETVTGAPKAKGPGNRAPKTTFEVRTEGRRVRCAAGVGRLEIKLDEDFTQIDRRRLEDAIRRLIDALR
jgi:ParB family chromosome partitioning protein